MRPISDFLGGHRSLAKPDALSKLDLVEKAIVVLVHFNFILEPRACFSKRRGFLSDKGLEAPAFDRVVRVLTLEKTPPSLAILCPFEVADDSSAGAVYPDRVVLASLLILPGTFQRFGDRSPLLRGDGSLFPAKTGGGVSRARFILVKADLVEDVVLGLVVTWHLRLAHPGRLLSSHPIRFQVY
jgi:hypothetical protein